MLEVLSRGFGAARERLRGVHTMDSAEITEALGDVRAALLEADVDLETVSSFLERVRERVQGHTVRTRVRDRQGRQRRATPGQHFVASCQKELEALMGPVDSSLARDARGTTSVMLLGLQGVGKTTLAAKLALHLRGRQRRPLLVAGDVQRPAALLQLQQLGERIGVPVYAEDPGDGAVALCRRGAERARSEGCDAVIYDTAGRLAIDSELMDELRELAEVLNPANRFLVCDALMGRDAVHVARSFAAQLTLDGLILTKLDGDARGGAALAMKAVTGVPIKFLSTGEALERLESFRPDGLASRILGMGDVVGLVEEFEAVVDADEAERDAERLLRGRFGMDDLVKQMGVLQKMGPLRDVLGKVPGGAALSRQVDESQLGAVQAMVQSMTPAERQRPELIDRSRASRIARGSGRLQSEVLNLVKRFHQLQQMMMGLGQGGGLLSGLPGLTPASPTGGAPPAGLLGTPQRSPPTNSAAAARKRKQLKQKRKQVRKDRRKGRKR